jgi:hypothetical protein
MEYQGWTVGEALREMRANGYGYVIASEYDDYIIQFLENYVPRKDRNKTQAVLAPPPHPLPPKIPAAIEDEKGGQQ